MIGGPSQRSSPTKAAYNSLVELFGARVGHIRIEQRIGSGGMGEVYRGFDEVLERPVAVKVIHSDRRMSGEAKMRFLREARLLSKLDHPGICRVYDLVEESDSDYLILELIEGQTLRELQTEELPQAERLRIVEGILEVLAEAHEQSIVHRDLKPDNVMVTPAGQVKVLDFGIARSLRAPADDPPDEAPAEQRRDLDDEPITEAMPVFKPAQTAPGTILGTVRYMSPEQASQGPVSEASDMYSLGVLLQELMTGSSAYGVERTGPELLLKVAMAETLPITGLEPDLAALIDDLQTRDPGSRPDAREARERLREVLDKPVRARRRRRAIAAGLVAAAALALAFVAGSWLLVPDPLLAEDEAARLAVLPFVNDTGDASLDWVEIGLMDLVAETVGVSDRLDVVPTRDTLKALEGLEIEHAEGLTPDELERLAAALGVRLLMTTSLKPAGAGYRLASTVVDSQGVRREVNAEGPELTAVAGQLAASLNQGLVREERVVQLEERFSSEPEANRMYAIGVQRLNTVGPEVANDYFTVCVDLDPTFVLARFQGAVCLEKAGEWDEAEGQARTVLETAETSGDLGLQAQAIQLIGILANDRGEWDRAQELWSRALEVFRSAELSTGVARSVNALAVLNFHRGERERAAELYAEALEGARSAGDRLLEGEVLTNLGVLAVAQRDHDAAESRYQEAAAIFRELGHRQREGVVEMGLGLMQWQGGLLDSADEHLARALELRRTSGDRQGEAVTLHCLGLVQWSRGDLETAAVMVQQSLDAFEALGDRVEASRALGNLGAILQEQGELERALEIHLGLVPLHQEMGNKPNEAVAHLNIAAIYLLQGRVDDAGVELALARELGDDSPDLLDVEARYHYERGRYRESVRLAEKAREGFGPAWNEKQEARLNAYRHAAETGQKVELE